MLKEYINKIIEKGKNEGMECLKDILVGSLLELKENKPEEFKKYKIKLLGMANDYEIDEEMAKEIVKDMKPLGEYWNIDTVANAINGDTHRLANMYVVMNSLANDYQGVINLEEVDTYINMAHAWLDDEDAKPHKAWNYFVN